MRINAKQWLEKLKPVKFEEFSVELDSSVFTFSGYQEKLKEARTKTELDEAVLTGIIDDKYVVAIFEPNFMMGTMSFGVGKKIINAIDISVKKNIPFVMISASGGARLQEGIFAVIQMSTIQFAYNSLKEAGLKSINVLADPTMGGVSASFAFFADKVVAIKGAQIGFTGKEVIKNNLLEEIPDNFQMPEKLLDEGLISEILIPEEVSKMINRELGLQ